MKEFDILLVIGYFRSATAYLSIVRHLSKEFRVGVLAADEDPALKSKTGDAHRQFMHLCVQFGATIVESSSPVCARLVLVQQFPYSDDFACRFEKLVSGRRRVGFMTLASAGLEPHDRFIEQFGIDKVFVPSRRLTEFLLHRRGAADRYRAVEFQEVGLPFARYPVFPEFSVDWLVVAPTLFSFHSEAGKQQFLGTVLQLLDQIPAKETVAYKPHNGNSLDYFAPRYHYMVARLLYGLRGSSAFLQRIARRLPRVLRPHIERIETSVLHLMVLRRVRAMRDCTPHADISLEAFLPGVHKGVIGGLSNTIWGALYFNLPFYNCVDPSLRADVSAGASRASTRLLDMNLEYFGLPYCEGDLGKGALGADIVRDSERAGDLLEAIRRCL